MVAANGSVEDTSLQLIRSEQTKAMPSNSQSIDQLEEEKGQQNGVLATPQNRQQKNSAPGLSGFEPQHKRRKKKKSGTIENVLESSAGVQAPMSDNASRPLGVGKHAKRKSKKSDDLVVNSMQSPVHIPNESRHAKGSAISKASKSKRRKSKSSTSGLGVDSVQSWCF